MVDLLKQEELRTLTDIGFIAASRGLQDHAAVIFEAVRVLRPEGEAGYLGLSMVDILKGNPAAAVATLKKAPESDAVNTFLGIALVQSSDIQNGRQVLQSVVKESADSPFARIATETLASVDATIAHT